MSNSRASSTLSWQVGPAQTPSASSEPSEPSEAGSLDTTAPAAHESPQKRKRKKVTTYAKLDAEVWALDDAEIISKTVFYAYGGSVLTTDTAASTDRWTSKVYDHYVTSLRRVETGAKKQLFFVFTCRFNSNTHEPHERARSKTSSGTTNLQKTAQKCDRSRGVALPPVAPTAVSSTAVRYSEAAHRAIIALRCATSHRPFNVVNDKYYKMEVELLRPGTKLPASNTVSLDIKHLYLELSKDVRTYFKVCAPLLPLDFSRMHSTYRNEIVLFTLQLTDGHRH
jgi:hypothetical protein